jgi:hypothetical protein
VQVVKCDPQLSIHLSNGEVIPRCERVVDQPRRLRVEVYHLSMAVPFVACTAVGAIFCSLTSREGSNIFSMNLLFVPDSYSPVGHHLDDSGGSSPMYTWELVFWLYVLLLHCTLVPTITSPVDVFDTAVSVIVGVASIMFLCRRAPLPPTLPPPHPHSL